MNGSEAIVDLDLGGLNFTPSSKGHLDCEAPHSTVETSVKPQRNKVNSLIHITH